MEVVYIVIEKQANTADATAYKTLEDARRAVEHLSGQSREEWQFDNGTIYLGDSNYETVAEIVESKVYDGVEKYEDR